MVRFALAGGRVSPAKEARGSCNPTLLALALVVSLLSAACAFAAPVAWVAPSYTRVMPDTAAGTATEISIYSAKGEWESAQVVVRGPATNVRVTVPASPLTLRLYQEHYHVVTKGAGTYATQVNRPDGPGTYPDALLPLPTSFNVASGQNQPVWVDVFAPRGVAPGLYTIPVTIAANEGTVTLTVKATVWNFAIPVKPALKSSFLHRNVRRNVAADTLMLDNRLMPISVATTEERRFIDTYGLNSSNVGFWASANKSAGTANAAPTTSAVSAEKAKHQQDLWFYAYTFDEISPYLGSSEPTLRDEVLAYAKALHGAGVDQLITTPPVTSLFDDGTGTGRSAVDVWVELPKQYNAALVNQAIAKGDEVWSYNCLNQDGYTPKWLMNYPFPNWRLQPGMINWQLGMTGLLYWSTDYWSSTQWDSVEAYGTSYPAEGLLIYRLPDATFAPSLRLKWLRDGVDDFDYLKLLDAAGQHTWAKGVVTSVATDWATWSHDPAAIEAVRRQLGEKLSTLSAPAHTFEVTASASPTTVASGGSASVTAAAADSSGHGIASWSWSDGGAGGSFSPSASAQNPSYRAATNATGANRTVTLTVTARCSGSPSATASDSTTLIVQSIVHTLSVTASASPDTVASGSSASLNATATDSLGHAIATWSWSDGGAGGSFAPSASVRNPSYTAAANSTESSRTVTLSVSATCNGSSPISDSDSTTISVSPVAHTLSVAAGVLPTTVGSGGSASLSASTSDSRGDAIIGWQWTDGGAGGSFVPSPYVVNPTYTAAANTTGLSRQVVLTVTATCDGSTPIAASASASLIVESAPHEFSVSASASPDTVESAGIVALTGAASDTLGDGAASWLWSDGGAGGTFLPSASVQSPTYTAAANASGADRIVTLTVSAACDGTAPASDSTSVSITVHPVPLALPVEAGTPVPAVVGSESTSSLDATTSDSSTDQTASWHWDDGGAEGSFLPSPNVRNPRYRAPRNASGRQMQVVLTVTASCDVPAPAAGEDSTSIVVEPAPHTLVVSGTASPASVTWKGRSQLSAAANDSLGDGIAHWLWSDNGAGGSFSPSAQVQNPVYKVAANSSAASAGVVISVTATCDGASPLTASGYLTLVVQPKPGTKTVQMARVVDRIAATVSHTVTLDLSDTAFSDLPAGYWATDAIEACRVAGIVGGFPDGTYRPNLPVGRDQVAVYLSRAVAGGDDLVPEGPSHASFSDVPTGHWAYRYIEYAKAKSIVNGYPDGRYYPRSAVNRAQLATFLARSMVVPSGDEGLESYQAPETPTFADVPTSHWAFRYVEFLAERGVASGYPDGGFQPDRLCSRAELAVYIARSFAIGE